MSLNPHLTVNLLSELRPSSILCAAHIKLKSPLVQMDLNNEDPGVGSRHLRSSSDACVGLTVTGSL